jgi:glycosyltransferase involved in cell wall biosynthesis
MSAPNRPVSVVMAVYNGRQFLQEQMSSVVSQLQQDDEFIVVDDASTDDSLEIVGQFAAPNLVLVRNSTNIGLRQTLQRGLLLARHEIIFLCDQDDVWLPGKRDACVAAFARDPRTLIVMTDAEVIDSHGNLISRSFIAERGGFNGTALGTLWRNRYHGCTMAIRATLLSLALPIPAGAPMHDMWFGVMGTLTGIVEYLPQPYLRYRRHGRNISPLRHQSILQMSKWRVRLMLAIAQRLVASKLGLHRRVGAWPT